MRFVSWQSHRMVGPGLVEPAWLAWDPDASFAALGYPDAVVLYRLQPQFTAFASLPLKVPPGVHERLQSPSPVSRRRGVPGVVGQGEAVADG